MKWQKGYEVHEGDSVAKGEEGFQGEVGIHMGPKGVGWIPSRPLPYAGPEILKIISLKVRVLNGCHATRASFF